MTNAARTGEFIRDFKIADYGWLRRLDVSSVDWVDYR